MIKSDMTGAELDDLLGAFANIQTPANNGMVLYILKGELAATTPENLFDIVIPEGGGG